MRLTLGNHNIMNQELHALEMLYADILGAYVLRIDSPTPDSVFHRDVFAYTPKGMIKCRMGNPNRVDEPDYWWYHAHMNDWVESEPHVMIREPGTFEGADLLWVDDYRRAIIGIGARTNQVAANQLAIWLKGFGIWVAKIRLPDWHSQHVLGVMNCIGNCLYAAERFCADLRDQLPWTTAIVRLPQEEYELKNSNWVQVGDTVVINRRCKQTMRLLERHAPVEVRGVAVDRLLDYGGGVACATGVVSPRGPGESPRGGPESVLLAT